MTRRNRNSNEIKRVTKVMGETMKCCAHTGLISRINAEKYMGLSKGNIEKMIKNGYLKSESVIAKGKMVNVYRLGSKGVSWIRNNTHIEYLYRSNPIQIQHDLKLSQFYNQLPEETRSTWRNEHQIMKQWSKYSSVSKSERATTVDALISTKYGLKIAVEVITNNYGKEELKDKLEAAQQLDCEKIITIKA